MKVLVTGGTGFVGRAVCRELSRNGYIVKVLHRLTSNLKPLADIANLELVPGDLADTESLRVACKDAEVVFHIAALYREAKFKDQVYWEANLEGTRRLLEASRETRVRRFIYCSTTGVMGHISLPPADETHPYNPDDVYQQSKAEAEKLVLEWFKSGKIEGLVIRPTMIWGPEDTRLFKIFKGVATKTLPVIGSGKTLNHYILVNDLARAFRLAAESPLSGEVYLVGGERVVTLEHCMETIAKCYGVKLFPIKIPAWPIQLLGSAVECICKPFGIEPPIHRRRADFFI